MSTLVWKLAAVVKIWLRCTGNVVFRSIMRLNTSPMVSMPSDSGVTSSSRRPLTSPCKTPPCSAAPMATHSSGLMSLLGSLPVKRFTAACTAGMRVEPPTSSTRFKSAGLSPASFMAWRTGSMVASTR